MTKRGIIGVGTLLLVIGISGLVLLQAGVILRPVALPEKLPEVQSLEQPAESPGKQIGQGEKKQLPNPENMIAKSPEPSVQGGNEAPPQNQSLEKPLLSPPVGSGNRVYPRQQSFAQSEPGKKQPGEKNAVRSGGTRYGSPKSESYARNEAGPRKELEHRAVTSKQPVVMRFQLDSAHSREIRVARVHFGDRVVVKVRRVGQADREVYLSFGLSNTYETRSYRGYSTGGARSVVTPIRDGDQLALTAESKFGPGLTSMLDSKEGAVLKLGARPWGDSRPRFARYDQGYYEIEMKIYPDNRWNIRPRSLL